MKVEVNWHLLGGKVYFIPVCGKLTKFCLIVSFDEISNSGGPDSALRGKCCEMLSGRQGVGTHHWR